MKVKTEATPTWTRYVLTNYHVVRPCFDGFNIDVAKKRKASLHVAKQEPQRRA